MLAGTQKPMLGTKTNRSHPLAKGLVGCWPFNEGGGDKVYDLSGYNNHGTLENMAFPPTVTSGWNPGKDGVGLMFNGTSNYVDCGNDASLNITDAITVEAWVKFNSISNFGAIASKMVSGAWNAGFSLFPYNGSLRFSINSVSSFVAIIPFSDTTNWHHVVGTYDKNEGNIKIYVDGIKGTDDSYTGSIITTSNDLVISKASGASFFLDGVMDEVKICNRALSAFEIGWLHRESYAMFERGELLL